MSVISTVPQVWVPNAEFARLEKAYNALNALIELGEICEVETDVDGPSLADQRRQLERIQQELARTPRGWWVQGYTTTNYTSITGWTLASTTIARWRTTNEW